MDLISDEEDYGEPDAGEAEEVAALGGEEDAVPCDKEEEGTAADDGPPKQAVMPLGPPPSA